MQRAARRDAPPPAAVSMKVRLVVVGKVSDRSLAAVIAEYEARAARYWPMEVVRVREEHGRDATLARCREGERLLEHAGTGTRVACDERGESLTSIAFAEWLQREREGGRDVSFIVGGAYGLDPTVRGACARVLTLAPFTLPHELARLVLAEQLYRAGTIVRREPYHKA